MFQHNCMCNCRLTKKSTFKTRKEKDILHSSFKKRKGNWKLVLCGSSECTLHCILQCPLHCTVSYTAEWVAHILHIYSTIKGENIYRSAPTSIRSAFLYSLRSSQTLFSVKYLQTRMKRSTFQRHTCLCAWPSKFALVQLPRPCLLPYINPSHIFHHWENLQHPAVQHAGGSHPWQCPGGICSWLNSITPCIYDTSIDRYTDKRFNWDQTRNSQ